MLSPPESPSILTASNLMSTSCSQCWRKREGCWRSSHTPHTPTHAPHPHPSLFTAAWVGLPFWFHVPEAGWALLSSHIQRHLAFERIIPPHRAKEYCICLSSHSYVQGNVSGGKKQNKTKSILHPTARVAFRFVLFCFKFVLLVGWFLFCFVFKFN